MEVIEGAGKTAFEFEEWSGHTGPEMIFEGCAVVPIIPHEGEGEGAKNMMPRTTTLNGKTGGVSSSPLNGGDDKVGPVFPPPTESDADKDGDGEEAEEGARSSSKHWIHSSQADVICAALICLNAVYLAIETELRSGGNVNHVGWFAADSIFNVVFLVELVLRLLAERSRWVKDPWNVFDALLVLMGIADTWLMPLVPGAGSQGNTRVMTLLRVFRLMRLARVLRLLRLLRFMKELSLLVHGVKGAMRAMIWGMLLIVITIFVSGMFLTRLVGKDCCEEGVHTFSNPNYAEWFGTLPLTAFTLFQFTMEFQADIARETFADGPWLALFLLAYVMFTNITLLNTVASVIVDNILSISQTEERSARAEEEKALRKETERLQAIFESLDVDGDGKLTWEELGGGEKTGEGSNSSGQKLSPELRKVLQVADISPEEAKDLFLILDADNSGSVSREEFVEGAMRVRGAPQSKHVLSVERKVAVVDRKVDRIAEGLADVTRALTELTATVAAREEAARHVVNRGTAAPGIMKVEDEGAGAQDPLTFDRAAREPVAAKDTSRSAAMMMMMPGGAMSTSYNNGQRSLSAHHGILEQYTHPLGGPSVQLQGVRGAGGGAAPRALPQCSPRKRRPGERRRLEQALGIAGPAGVSSMTMELDSVEILQEQQGPNYQALIEDVPYPPQEHPPQPQPPPVPVSTLPGPGPLGEPPQSNSTSCHGTPPAPGAPKPRNSFVVGGGGGIDAVSGEFSPPPLARMSDSALRGVSTTRATATAPTPMPDGGGRRAAPTVSPPHSHEPVSSLMPGCLPNGEGEDTDRQFLA